MTKDEEYDIRAQLENVSIASIDVAKVFAELDKIRAELGMLGEYFNMIEKLMKSQFENIQNYEPLLKVVGKIEDIRT